MGGRIMKTLISPRHSIAISMLLCIPLFPCYAARATLVAPGQSFTPLESDRTEPIPGTVVATSTKPFHIDYMLKSSDIPNGELSGPEFVDGSVLSRVIRDH